MLKPEILKKQIRDLAQKGMDIAENKSMNRQAQMTSLDAIDTQLKTLRDELASSEFVTAKNRAWGVDTWGNSGAGEYPTSNSRPVIGAAPSIQLAADEVDQLFRAAKSQSRFRLELKGANANIGDSMPPVLMPGIVGLSHEPTRIADLLPTAQMAAPSLEYLRHIATTGAAATVAPGGLKPEVIFMTDTITLKASKIAAVTGVFDESLQDFAGFAQFISGELNRVYTDAENLELLSGSGTAPDMTGLLNVSGLIVRPKGTDTALDALEQASSDLRVGPTYTGPTLYIMNPTDFGGIRRAKDSQGRYLVNPDPTVAATSALWGVPVVQTTTIPQGTALALNTVEACQLFYRQGVTVDTSNSSTDDYVRNVTRFRIEARLGLAVVKPSAIVKITGLGA